MRACIMAVQKGEGELLTITIEVNAPGWAAQGIKEDIAMHLEKYGDARVVSVKEGGPRDGREKG